ncbi:MAG: GerMN domain-containing protein [Sphaerochaeta sp.]|nr:GerMN domain-containing protein [Sphaerochaeta sp.]MDX9914538.1 GerMN domain-containing protein [Sphaerochaeta sp.]
MDNEKRPRGRPLLILFIWLLFTGAVAIVGYPMVKAAVVDSGVPALLFAGTTEQASPASSRLVRCAFILPDKSTALYAFRAKRLGGSAYHDTYEALLRGAPREALAEAAVSYIESDTRLRGVTLSNSILFVDFDSTYRASPDRVLADEQVRATGLAMSAVKGVVILVEGSPID